MNMSEAKEGGKTAMRPQQVTGAVNTNTLMTHTYVTIPYK